MSNEIRAEKHVKLFIPGPTEVRPEVLDAQTDWMIGHRMPECLDLIGRIRPKLRTVFMTEKRVLINASTGTITVTASFANPEGTLIPGQFARIVLQRGEPEVQLLVPQSSVLEDMQGRYVYIVADDDTVARRNVTLGQREGIDWVVLSGLEEGDRVIVHGIQKVRPGMPVTASPVTAQPYRETTGAE